MRTEALAGGTGLPEDRARAADSVGRRVLVVLLYTAIAAAAVWGGLVVRHWAWNYARPIRSVDDLQTALRWGSFGLTENGGPLGVYDQILHERSHPISAPHAVSLADQVPER